MGAYAHDDSRQGRAFLAHYAAFAEFLEELKTRVKAEDLEILPMLFSNTFLQKMLSINNTLNQNP